MFIELVMPSNQLILCHPLLLPLSIFPNIRVFSNESVLPIRWPKYWSFSFSISLSNEYSGLISFRIDWLDHFAVQGTLKSILQHKKQLWKALILWRSAFFIVQLSHPCMTTWKIIAVTRWTYVGKVMSLLFNMLCMLVITFLPRSKCLLISWLQSPSAVIFSSVHFSCSVVSDSLRPMNHSTPGLPVHHQLPGPTQTHVHWVGDAIQPSHHLLSPSSPALNLSQHQGIFKWVSSLHQVAKVLEFQLQHQSFQWTSRTDLL